MNAPFTPPPSCIPQMRCGERGSRTIWTTTSTTTVLLSLGTTSSSSFRTLHGLLQWSRKERKGKEARKRARRRRRPSSSSACVSVCAQFGRHLKTRSQRQQRPGLIFSRLYIYIYIYIYSQKGYLLCKLKVLKSSAFSDFLSQKKSKKISPKKIK
jgi:hypothetical protein